MVGVGQPTPPVVATRGFGLRLDWFAEVQWWWCVYVCMLHGLPVRRRYMPCPSGIRQRATPASLRTPIRLAHGSEDPVVLPRWAASTHKELQVKTTVEVPCWLCMRPRRRR